MVTSSNGSIFRVSGLLCGEFTGHQWNPRTGASDVELWCFLWSEPWINGLVNNDDTGDLRCHHAHYDATVMLLFFTHVCIIQPWCVDSPLPSTTYMHCWYQGCQPVRNFRILYGIYMQNTGVRIWPTKYGNWALSVLSHKVLLPEQSLPVLGCKSVKICGILCLKTFKFLFNHQNIQSSLFHM